MHSLYVALVVAHVACAVVGFGALALAGIYGWSGRSPDGDRQAEAARWFASPNRAAWAVLAVPVLGLVALAVEPGGQGPGQLWDVLALVVWAVAAATWLVVVRPAEARLRATVASSGGGTWTADAASVGRAAAVTDVAFVVALVLMLFQP